MLTSITTAATALALATTPALAGQDADVSATIYTDSNSHFLDYKTDLSEARRELESDLSRANDAQDRIEAYAEYEAEVADAETDFRKEMAERGGIVPTDAWQLREGRVTIEQVAMIGK